MMRTPIGAALLALLPLLTACSNPVRVPRDAGTVDCGASLDCNCVDGTATFLVCAGSCAPFCASHGGVEPSGKCATGETLCNGLCRPAASLSADPNNCGGCNVKCTEYTACSDGKCTAALADGSFACRQDSDCSAGESCVLNPASNCPLGPFCAPTCPATCGNGAACATALDVGTNATISACIAADHCS